MKALTLTVAGTLAVATLAASVATADAGPRRGYHHHHHRPHHAYRAPNPGAAVAGAAIFGIVAGALASQAFAPPPAYYAPPVYPVAPPPPYPNTYYAPSYPAYAGNAHVAWCSQKYRSYNVNTDTWMDYSGNIRRCVSPY